MTYDELPNVAEPLQKTLHVRARAHTHARIQTGLETCATFGTFGKVRQS